MADIYYAPVETPKRDFANPDSKIRIFLAGSINMGSATEWQQKVIDALQDTSTIIYNPRRLDWDSSWEQSKNNPKFVEQVEWELDHIHDADIVCFYFDPVGYSPITLLELGLILNHGVGQEVIVCCSEGFWRKGNVDVTCNWMHHSQVHQVNTLDEMIETIRSFPRYD